ncbi:MAG: phosphotransferase family protein [Burkholderiales bacterium]|nr:phosphotransferase family protein [Burkholderiales bacterium]MDE1926222.1 phosphotransferase family protein [Burkholderiales bacterium]MDE2157850.1 phosphotransferase family protein [Burkholderiales bacterium]MDE2502826.1 phosphotransferase family protein [Burkholderiales bacterium]
MTQRAHAAPMAEADALAPRLGDWCAQRLPQRGAVAVRRLRASAGGFSNVTLLGELVSSEGGVEGEQGIVVRIAGGGDGVFPKGDLRRQVDCLQRLAGSAVPVPELIGFESDVSWLGAPFYVMARVEGQVPNENPLYHLEGWLHDLDPAQRRCHWLAGIDTIAAVARIDWRARGFADLLPPAGRPPLAHQLERCLAHLRWSEGLGRPYPLLHDAYRWLHAHQPDDEPVALQWGDAKLGNCVYRDGAVVAALDWEEPALGSPVDDLAWWLTLDDSMSTGYGVPRLAGLPTREETVAHWERASGHSARHLDYYEVFTAWRFAIVMTRIGTIFTQRGLVPPQAEMDLRNGGAVLLRQLADRHGF